MAKREIFTVPEFKQLLTSQLQKHVTRVANVMLDLRKAELSKSETCPQCKTSKEHQDPDVKNCAECGTTKPHARHDRYSLCESCEAKLEAKNPRTKKSETYRVEPNGPEKFQPSPPAQNTVGSGTGLPMAGRNRGADLCPMCGFEDSPGACACMTKAEPQNGNLKWVHETPGESAWDRSIGSDSHGHEYSIGKRIHSKAGGFSVVHRHWTPPDSKGVSQTTDQSQHVIGRFKTREEAINHVNKHYATIIPSLDKAELPPQPKAKGLAWKFMGNGVHQGTSPDGEHVYHATLVPGGIELNHQNLKNPDASEGPIGFYEDGMDDDEMDNPFRSAEAHHAGLKGLAPAKPQPGYQMDWGPVDEAWDAKKAELSKSGYTFKEIHREEHPHGTYHAEDHGAGIAGVYFQSKKQKKPRYIATARGVEGAKQRIADHMKNYKEPGAK